MTVIASLVTRPCTLHTRVEDDGTRDEMGDPTVTFTDVETVCELQQSQATEERDGRLLLVSTWNLYLLPGESLDGWSELTVDDIRYTLDGAPWPVRHPITGEASHVEARVRRVA